MSSQKSSRRRREANTPNACPAQPLPPNDPARFSRGRPLTLPLPLSLRSVPTIAYMQPGPPQPGQTDEPGLAGVGIEHAFTSPQTLANCSDFLRKHASDTRAQSAMIVVRKNHVQYPCTWKGSGKAWPCDARKDGIIMQLEARNARALFFTEITKAPAGGFSMGETHQLDADEFALFPRLFT